MLQSLQRCATTNNDSREIAQNYNKLSLVKCSTQKLMTRLAATTQWQRVSRATVHLNTVQHIELDRVLTRGGVVCEARQVAKLPHLGSYAGDFVINRFAFEGCLILSPSLVQGIYGDIKKKNVDRQ